MSASYSLAARPIVVELHAVLRDLDPASLRDGMEAALRVRLGALREKLEAMRSMSAQDDSLERLRAQLAELERILRSAAAETREDWIALGKRLRPAYEQLRVSLLGYDIHVPALRPTNYRRNLLHVCSGFFALTVILGVPSPAWMIAITAVFFLYAWPMEFLRHRHPKINERVMTFYGPIAHPHEKDRINSATWYATALMGLALTGSTVTCAVAVLVLGIGDPAAAIVGRRFGRTKLINGRSLEGSLTFVASAGAVALTALLIFFPELTVAQAVLLAFGGALGGAVAELLSRRVDDNC
jgi:dolichol kinase